jgi:dipeptidyl aminopeptidase/acylaminoacyl peptidase
MKELTAEMISHSLLPVDLDLSPDGGIVVYALIPIGKSGKFPTSTLWTATTNMSSQPRQFTFGIAEDRHPRWSPDGKSIAFLSDRFARGNAQLFLINADGGESRPLTYPKITKPVSDFAWSPDGRLIAFTSPDETPVNEEDDLNDVKIYERSLPNNKLRLISTVTGEMRTLVETNKHVRDFAWSSDGIGLVYVLQQSPLEEWESREVTAERTSIDGETRKICSFPSLIGSPTWSSDGRTIYFLGPINQQASRKIFVVSADSGKSEGVFFGEESCVGALINSGGDRVAALEWQGLESRLLWLNQNKRSLEALFPNSEAAFDSDIASPVLRFVKGTNSVIFAGTMSEASSPWEIWIGSGDESGSIPTCKKITRHNEDFERINFGVQQRFEWKASDGLSLDGFLLWPPKHESGRKLPTVVLIHGGPYGRYANGFQVGWSNWAQWLATAGYLVLMVNPRGGSGHGEKFASQAKGDVGGADYEDVMSAVDAVVDRGYADPKRLAIGGWSQGGFMSACAVTKTNRFKAAILGAGISDWESLVATSNVPDFERDLTGRAPWEEVKKDQKVAYSPIKYAKNVKTPVLILHGQNDDRIPLGQALGFYRALKENGVETEFVIYPREPHIILERAHQIDLLFRVRSWYDRWLRDT